MIPVSHENEAIWARMCACLWPRNTAADFLTARCCGEYCHEFLYPFEDTFAGFLSLSIRNDYVEGTSHHRIPHILVRKGVLT